MIKFAETTQLYKIFQWNKGSNYISYNSAVSVKTVWAVVTVFQFYHWPICMSVTYSTSTYLISRFCQNEAKLNCQTYKYNIWHEYKNIIYGMKSVFGLNSVLTKFVVTVFFLCRVVLTISLFLHPERLQPDPSQIQQWIGPITFQHNSTEMPEKQKTHKELLQQTLH